MSMAFDIRTIPLIDSQIRINYELLAFFPSQQLARSLCSCFLHVPLTHTIPPMQIDLWTVPGIDRLTKTANSLYWQGRETVSRSLARNPSTSEHECSMFASSLLVLGLGRRKVTLSGQICRMSDWRRLHPQLPQHVAYMYGGESGWLGH